jgi:hypothetical protein
VAFWGKASMENNPGMMGFLNHVGTPPNLQSLDPVIEEGDAHFHSKQEKKRIAINIVLCEVHLYTF